MGNFSSLVFPKPSPPEYTKDHPQLLWIERTQKNKTTEMSESNNYKDKDSTKIPCMLTEAPHNSNTILLYFHGNASDLGKSQKFCEMLSSEWNMNVLSIEYPTYGVYEGVTLGEKSIKEDSLIIFDYLVEKLKIPNKQILVLGRSIGGGPATFLASERKIGGLILF